MACVDKDGIVFQRKTMLSVASGERGLRQSDGVFLHVRHLESLFNELFDAACGRPIAAVAVSARPTDAPDSYMPVFLAGVAGAAAAAGALRVPLIKTSHQRGHIRAALLGNEVLLKERSFLALHLSGGTTDMLRVETERGRIAAVERIGGSEDLHVGQMVDRVGVGLGLDFPAGPALECLARQALRRNIRLPAAVRGLTCSFSGPESQAQRLMAGGAERAEIAFGVYDCIARTVGRLIEAAGASEALLVGGVAGSALLTELLARRTQAKLRRSETGLSGDNAVGVALLGLEEAEGREV
ncbi:MAG: O-sialoglycoprotein endopeptidase [Clostridia bacterium]|nr:O-sialoglycoprotein endopeptidase [Clostridia bacterium]